MFKNWLLYTRVMIAVFAAVAVVTALSVSNVGKARATTCYGDYCSGQDPMGTGCAADAITTVAKGMTGASLQVRWSPSCQTNWTRLVVYATGVGCVIDGELKAVQDTNYTQSSQTSLVCNTSSATTFWTPMIYSPIHHVKGWYQSFGLFTPVVETAWS